MNAINWKHSVYLFNVSDLWMKIYNILYLRFLIYLFCDWFPVWAEWDFALLIKYNINIIYFLMKKNRAFTEKKKHEIFLKAFIADLLNTSNVPLIIDVLEYWSLSNHLSIMKHLWKTKLFPQTREHDYVRKILFTKKLSQQEMSSSVQRLQYNHKNIQTWGAAVWNIAPTHEGMLK